LRSLSSATPEIEPEESTMNDKTEAVRAVRERMAQAAEHSGRRAADVELVAVSKGKPVEELNAAYVAGVRHFGENRSAELAEKATALAHLPDLQWHFIGHLQSRQVQDVARHAHCFHAVDRIKIAERMQQALEEEGRELAVYLQVNVSGEESKGGFECDAWPEEPAQLTAFFDAVRAIAAMPRLQVLGLMTMAPYNATENALRTVFSRLHSLSERLDAELPGLDARGLSMGMSGDFEIAIEEGSTLVRVGSAIFGARG
jgi:pyridoxal phosphate enzyme (YggS family)